jgi:hypothetical protein
MRLHSKFVQTAFLFAGFVTAGWAADSAPGVADALEELVEGGGFHGNWMPDE